MSHLATMPPRRFAALRGNSSRVQLDGSVQIDAKDKIIHGASVATLGQAKGWPFSLDDTSLDQIVDFGNRDPLGVKCRLGHPETETKIGPDGALIDTMAEAIGTQIGRVANFRRDGDRVRADLIFGDYATVVPGKGDVATYLLKLAAEDPTSIGLSAVFPYTIQTGLNDNGSVNNPARLQGLDAVDIVENPAANPTGLLSVPRATAFDPQPSTPPPSDPNSAGWADDDPRDWAAAPLPVETADSCLSQMCNAGTLTLADLAANMDPTTASCKNPFVMMRGKLNRMVSAGLATCDDGVNYRPTPAAYARIQPSGYGTMAAQPGDPLLDSAKRQKAMEDAGHLLMRHLLNSESSPIPIPPPSPGVDQEREQQLSQDGMPPAAPGVEPFPTEDLNRDRDNMLAAAGFAARQIALNQEISDAGILQLHIDKAKDVLLSRPGKLYEIADRFISGEPVNLIEDGPDDEGEESDLAARPQIATASAKSIPPPRPRLIQGYPADSIMSDEDKPNPWRGPHTRMEQGFPVLVED